MPSSSETTEYRSQLCGHVSEADVGSEVQLCGWVQRRREHGEHLAFVDLRDYSGVIQCVVDNTVDVRPEWVIKVTGTVTRRPDGTVNEALASGTIEVTDATVEVLGRAEPPPFPVDERADSVDESLRLRHRYLDIRRPRMQRNLRLRSKINQAIRAAMLERDFVEIETPLLIASTPEGARDFVVPSRLRRGSFYALPQSPQLYKQLSMVGGIDRYFQIARCLRDEDLRADRQLEFSQLDLEMSFVTQADVLVAVEAAVRAAANAADVDLGEVATLTWREAMDRFGSDKPDMRFGMELVDVTDVFSNTGFNAFKAPCIKAIVAPGLGEIGRSRLDDLTDRAKRLGAKGLVWMRVGEEELQSPVAKFCNADELAALRERSGAQSGDLLLLVADKWLSACQVLGSLRVHLGAPPVSEGGLHAVWVVEFPLFEGITETGHLESAHNPFTMPHPEDLGLVLEASEQASRGAIAAEVAESLLNVRSQAYDLVINGWELGSGSVRIHRPDTQSAVFDLLGIDREEAHRQFGFLLRAFEFGAPPHAGFAFGIDRLSAILCGEESIREVIAFPKTQSGGDPMTDAPSSVADAQLAELGLKIDLDDS